LSFYRILDILSFKQKYPNLRRNYSLIIVEQLITNAQNKKLNKNRLFIERTNVSTIHKRITSSFLSGKCVEITVENLRIINSHLTSKIELIFFMYR
jgi:hypothetical protein